MSHMAHSVAHAWRSAVTGSELERSTGDTASPVSCCADDSGDQVNHGRKRTLSPVRRAAGGELIYRAWSSPIFHVGRLAFPDTGRDLHSVAIVCRSTRQRCSVWYAFEMSKISAVNHSVNQKARPDQSTSVIYAFLDADLRPLYVGATCRLHARINRHRSQRAWWPEVSYLTWFEPSYGDRARMRTEGSVITALTPKYNQHHNHGQDVAGLVGVRRADRLADYPYTEDLWAEAIISRSIINSAFSILTVAPGRISQWVRP